MLNIIGYISNYIKSRTLVKALFPYEKWIHIEHNIWVSKSRLIQKVNEPKKWEKEMSQVHILTNMGCVAFFLPEIEVKGEKGKRCADLVLDGEVMEMKIVAGTRATLGGQFKYGFKQGAMLLKGKPVPQIHSVFVYLQSNLSLISVMSKIAGELKNRTDQGRFICYFEKTGELKIWTYDELKAIISKK